MCILDLPTERQEEELLLLAVERAAAQAVSWFAHTPVTFSGVMEFCVRLQLWCEPRQGVDRVLCVSAADASTLLLRQYRIRLKKTGTKVRM